MFSSLFVPVFYLGAEVKLKYLYKKILHNLEKVL
jgi:hypothetical protein